MENNEFIPADFEVPGLLDTDQFRLRMLSVDDVEKDYEAVMESRELLQSLFRGSWPREGFTIEENLRDLEQHQRELLEHKAFAYTVISLDESKVLGCLYINPPKTGEEADAVVHMWVRQSEFDKGMDPILFDTVKKWLEAGWPFTRVAYPGREV